MGNRRRHKTNALCVWNGSRSWGTSCAGRKQTIFATNIYELRASRQGVHYRMLYFFCEGRAIMSHGLTKEGKVPDTEIERAIERKRRFEQNPEKHTHRE